MDRKNNPIRSTDERIMEQVLSGFQRLLLSSPAESSHQQDPENESEVSEYDVIDPEVAAAELNHVLETLPWRKKPPKNEEGPLMWSYFNLTMQIMEDLHKQHSQLQTDTSKKTSQQLHANMSFQRNQSSSSLSDMRPTSLDYLFKCSKCCDMFSMLYDQYGADQPSPSRQSYETSTRTYQNSNEPSPSHVWRTSTDPGASSYADESLTSIRPQRPSLSPVPNLPSTSRQDAFGFFEQPSTFEGSVSTSPVPNLPSTSRGYIQVDTDQSDSSSGVPTLESLIDNERKRKFLRIKKEKSMYQRKIRK